MAVLLPAVVTIHLAADPGTAPVVDARTLAEIERSHGPIRVLVHGELRFCGTVDELRVLAFDADGAAGESAVERAIRTIAGPA